MSRAKFEEWFKDKGYEFTAPHLYDAWLAGRESMRDEAANYAEGEFDFCGDELLVADGIRKIKL